MQGIYKIISLINNKVYIGQTRDIRASKKEIALRDGGNQGYKLPLGYHYNNNKIYYCILFTYINKRMSV